jgi:hypothetical protein
LAARRTLERPYLYAQLTAHFGIDMLDYSWVGGMWLE